MEQSWAPLLLVAFFSTLPWHSEGQGVITMVATSYVVKEGQMFAVRVRKAGTASSEVNVVVEVRKNASDVAGFNLPVPLI